MTVIPWNSPYCPKCKCYYAHLPNCKDRKKPMKPRRGVASKESEK